MNRINTNENIKNVLEIRKKETTNAIPKNKSPLSDMYSFFCVLIEEENGEYSLLRDEDKAKLKLIFGELIRKNPASFSEYDS